MVGSYCLNLLVAQTLWVFSTWSQTFWFIKCNGLIYYHSRSLTRTVTYTCEQWMSRGYWNHCIKLEEIFERILYLWCGVYYLLSFSLSKGPYGVWTQVTRIRGIFDLQSSWFAVNALNLLEKGNGTSFEFHCRNWHNVSLTLLPLSGTTHIRDFPCLSPHIYRSLFLDHVKWCTANQSNFKSM